MEDSFSEGREKGEVIGIEKGDNIRVRKTVLNMHKLGIDIDIISKTTELAREAVGKIIKEAASEDE